MRVLSGLEGKDEGRKEGRGREGGKEGVWEVGVVGFMVIRLDLDKKK